MNHKELAKTLCTQCLDSLACIDSESFLEQRSVLSSLYDLVDTELQCIEPFNVKILCACNYLGVVRNLCFLWLVGDYSNDNFFEQLSGLVESALSCLVD